MKKQHLEGILSKTLKYYSESETIWYLKLQNNPLAHHTTPADFLILTKTSRILIECKETRTNTFAFDRITQLYDLKQFYEIMLDNFAYILICFWDTNIKKSDFYLIDAIVIERLITQINKKSINRNEAKVWLEGYKLETKNGYLNLDNTSVKQDGIVHIEKLQGYEIPYV